MPAYRFLHAVFLIAVSTSLVVAQDDVSKKELIALSGTWQPISIETDGKSAPEERLKEITVVRDEAGKTIVRRGEMIVLEGIVTKLDATKKPKTFDTEVTAGDLKGKTIIGIYEIVDDMLRICVALPNKAERPTAFSAKAGSGCNLAVYKRVKK